jgi:hypothetical protein
MRLRFIPLTKEFSLLVCSKAVYGLSLEEYGIPETKSKSSPARAATGGVSFGRLLEPNFHSFSLKLILGNKYTFS